MRKQLTVILFLWIVAVFPARSAFAQLGQPGDAPAAASTASAAAPAAAAAQADQTSPIAKTPCGSAVAAPTALPPAGSPPFVWILEPCFNSQGGSSTIENETYMYYIQLRPSTPSQKHVRLVRRRRPSRRCCRTSSALWATNFLDDLSIEVTDHTFPNGTVGKIVTYHMEERERVKIVDYRDTDEKSISIIKRSDIDEKLRERTIELRLDSFLDEGTIRRVEGVLREMMAEKGFTNAEVSHQVTPVAGGPKLVNVTFMVGEGPEDQDSRRRVRRQTRRSATASSRRQHQGEQAEGIRSTAASPAAAPTRKTKFEEDAAKVVEYYQNSGYPQARVGQPEVKTLENTKDGKTRVDSAADPRDRGRALQVRRR